MDRLKILGKKLRQLCFTENTRCFRTIHAIGILIVFDTERYEVCNIIAMFFFLIHPESIKD